ncbi:MAG: DNA gyrase subunit A, partial [Bacilli bacterium]|nr:DNA gyrase subunit A [Bacilli bacterium]
MCIRYIDNCIPRTLGLKDIISKYIDHQKEVIIRRTRYDLAQDEDRVHILQGLQIALDHIDEVVAIIRGADDDDDARSKLMSRFGLSEIQANSILEMRLRRLTGLEREKIDNELNELMKEIEELKSILASNEKVLNIIKEEMLEIKRKYGDERRTSIDMTAIDYIEDESLIPVEDIIVSLTDKGYIKRLNSDTYRSQHRGGVGVKGMSINEEDYVKYLINCKTHDDVLFFTTKGKVYRVRGYEIPLYSRQSKGLPIINLIPIEKEEKISSVIKITPSSEDAEFEGKYITFATKSGLVKKTPIEEFINIRNSGKIAIGLKEDDELIDVKLSTGNSIVILGSSSGRMVVFNEEEIRPMGRTASGVKGITLDGAECIGMEVGSLEDNLLVVTKNGYGKKTLISEYRMTKRGSKGVKALNITDKNGDMISHKIVTAERALFIIAGGGVLV